MTGRELYLKLRDMQNIPNSHENWAEYREKVTDYLIRHSDNDRSIAILGAGKCDDVDLAKLKQHFFSITLIDRNEDAMKEALEKYGLSNDPDVEIVVKDFIGITDEMYSDYAEAMITELNKKGKDTDVEQAAIAMINKLDEIFDTIKDYNPNLGIQQYDYVAALGVHSQLVNMLIWIWAVGLSNIGKSERTLEMRAKREDAMIVHKFNDQLLLMARRGVFLGCEMSRAGMSGGVEGALQAMGDMHGRNEHKQVHLEGVASVTWPFDPQQNILYQMCLMNIKTNV